jgi:uncharacterized membrane protein
MRIVRALFTTLLEGFFILLPVLIAYVMVGQLFDLLMALTAPITDVMPGTLFSDEWERRATAALLLIGIFLLFGLAAKTRLARGFGSWLERTLLDRFPPYSVLKSLSQRLGGKDEVDKLQPALLTVAPDTRMLVAIVEALPNDQLTVFVPMAPTPALGVLQIVSSAKVERLESSMAEALGWVLNWGAGTGALLKPRGATRREPRPVS